MVNILSSYEHYKKVETGKTPSGKIPKRFVVVLRLSSRLVSAVGHGKPSRSGLCGVMVV
jgi:hypothetical protein